MCLIVYSRDGALMPRDVFVRAREANSDGIGVMSRDGVRRWCGPKSGKKAWRYLRQLAEAKIPYGVHFRYATHGSVRLTNTHPFRTESGQLVMHNGVISETAAFATAEQSDTALYVEWALTDAPDGWEPGASDYYDAVESDIGYWNKLLVYHPVSDAFTICNPAAGTREGSFWYSNSYSLRRPTPKVSRWAGWGADWIEPRESFSKRLEADAGWYRTEAGTWRWMAPESREVLRAAEVVPSGDYLEECEARGLNLQTGRGSFYGED